MPLLQFALQELFERRTEGRTLTFEAYNEIGGMEAVLARRAEQELSQLDRAVQQALTSLLRALVTVGQGAQDPVVARRVPLDPLSSDPARKLLLDRLIRARLLVTDRTSEGQAVVGIVHEALLYHWPRLKEILDKDREFLRTRDRVAHAAARWQQEGRSADLLLPEGRPLAEAKDLLARRREELDAEVVKYIEASINRHKWQHRRRAIFVAAFFVLVTVFGTFSFVQWQIAREQQQAADEQRTLAVRERDLALEVIHRLTYDIPVRFRNVPGTIPVLTAILEENVRLLDRIRELDPDNGGSPK